jgi:hypothetical protein
MPTECSTLSLDFGTVEGRRVEAAFDAGLVTYEAGALLLGATDRAIGMIDRFALCFHDERPRSDFQVSSFRPWSAPRDADHP